MTVYPVCTSRITTTELYQWCANTYDKEVIDEGSILVVMEDRSYYRLICIDDGRVYHMNHYDYHMCTREIV